MNHKLIISSNKIWSRCACSKKEFFQIVNNNLHLFHLHRKKRATGHSIRVSDEQQKLFAFVLTILLENTNFVFLRLSS